MSILIKNGRVLNPSTKTDAILDILTEDSKIVQIAERIESQDADMIIDASGCYVMPGLIDMHVHLRDPGLTYKETLETGTAAAVHGGFTTIVAMANTIPVIDDAEKLTQFYKHADKVSPIQVLQVGSVTKGMAGHELTNAEELKKAGAPALSEDGKTVMDAALFRKALYRAAALDIPILDHCEDAGLKGDGVVNQGNVSEKLHLTGISNAVEDTIMARDILLAKEAGARLHICHCSTADSVKILLAARKDGIHVTAEVCPHHFTLTDEDIIPEDSNYKMAPPLRTRNDVNALIEGLKNGAIDVISSDHAPHAASEKTSDITSAAFGIVGLETSVPLTISELVIPGHLTPLQMAEKMSYNPARILGIDKGVLAVGKDADITIINPGIEFTINKETFKSMGRNTPFHQRKVHGKVMYTIYNGRLALTGNKAGYDQVLNHHLC